MRRPGPWRTPVLPSGGSVGSLRLAGPALPSAPRRDAAGLEARARARAPAAAASPASDAVAGGLGTAWRGAASLPVVGSGDAKRMTELSH
ncbi:hypothetical protein ZWY2020_000558 [Hordeum vulgare]|nr:hypothetical protein ZWY2020_000558 [Hordeum vulgare]